MCRWSQRAGLGDQLTSFANLAGGGIGNEKLARRNDFWRIRVLFGGAHLGLSDTGLISRITVNPFNSSNVFVCAMGVGTHLWPSTFHSGV
jgi:hypothetical protein